MYILNFTLKQHTPIIHFQHDQDGATLRATEVKPKLDRFLLMTLGRNADPNLTDEEEIYEMGKFQAVNRNWLIDPEKGAINYKLNILPQGELNKFYITSNPNGKNDGNRNILIVSTFNAEYLNCTQYFGNNENLKLHKIEKEDEVKLGLISEKVIITLKSFNRDLISFLEANDKVLVKSFFILNNFGTRQSKGFGCFLPENIEEQDIKRAVSYDNSVLGIFKRTSKSDFRNKLQEIAIDYSYLKRGKTYNGYDKSKLWKYLCASKKLRWEKRKIKMNMIEHNIDLFKSLKYETNIHRIDDCLGNDDKNSFMFVRAVLGLAEQYEFVKFDNTRVKVHVSDTSAKKIDRFKSPLSYIITDTSIYMIVHSIPKLLTTYIDENGIENERYFNFSSNGVPDFRLKIPMNFDILEFISKESEYIKI